MSRQNSIEKRLLDNATTLKKVTVDCDINAWMETNRKQLPSPKNKIFFRPKIKQKSTKIIPLKLETIHDELERDASAQRLLFEKKEHTKTCSTRHSNRIRNLTILENQPSDPTHDPQSIPSPELASKPFNTGFVLKELRKRVKQRSQLKKFSQAPNDRLTRSDFLDQLDTGNSIRYFQREFRRLDVLSSRGKAPR